MNFTYIIQDLTNQQYYSGVRFSINATPESLLTTYFSSSPEVHNRIDQGHHFIVRKIRLFEYPEQAIEHEYAFQKRVDVKNNDAWINDFPFKASQPTSKSIANAILTRRTGKTTAQRRAERLKIKSQRDEMPTVWIERLKARINNIRKNGVPYTLVKLYPNKHGEAWVQLNEGRRKIRVPKGSYRLKIWNKKPVYICTKKEAMQIVKSKNKLKPYKALLTELIKGNRKIEKLISKGRTDKAEELRLELKKVYLEGIS